MSTKSSLDSFSFGKPQLHKTLKTIVITAHLRDSTLYLNSLNLFEAYQRASRKAGDDLTIKLNNLLQSNYKTAFAPFNILFHNLYYSTFKALSLLLMLFAKDAVFSCN